MLRRSEEVIKTLRATPIVLRAITAAIDAGRLRRRPAPGQCLSELESLSEQGWQRTGRHGQHGDMTIELYETHAAAEEVDPLPRSLGSSSTRGNTVHRLGTAR